MRLRTLACAAVLTACLSPSAGAQGTADRTSGAGISIPTTLNFCGEETVDLYVTICNSSERPVFYEVQFVDSSPVFDCNLTVVPDHLRWEVTKLIQPGQCAPYRITLYRPPELDQESVVCTWIRAGEVGSLNVWLGGRLIDNRLACVEIGEVEGALWLHPQVPIEFTFDLVNHAPFPDLVEYELLAKGPDGSVPQGNLSFNGADPAESYGGAEFLEPGESTQVSVALEWTDPEETGMFELSVEGPVFDKGGYPVSEVFALPVGNADAWAQPTAAPVTAAARLGLSMAPNPFNPRTTVSFELARPGPVVLDVLDLRGRRVRRMLDDRLEGGSHDTVWDGQDDQGDPAPSGTYLFRVLTENGQVTAKGVLLK